MSFTDPFGAQNYLGSHASDSAAETFLTDAGFPLVDGLWYYRSTGHLFVGRVDGVWKEMVSAVNDTELAIRTGIDLSFFNSSTPYLEVSQSIPQVLARFVYPGTSVGTPSRMKIVGSRNGPSGISTIDIRNAGPGGTIGDIIASKDFAASGIAIYTEETLSNLPPTECILEIRAYTTGSKTRLHYISVR